MSSNLTLSSANFANFDDSPDKGATMINRHLKLANSNIDSVGYDIGSRTLEIVFTTDSNAVYSYANVDAETFAELINAESVGGFFVKSIRPHTKLYPFTKTDNTPPR